MTQPDPLLGVTLHAIGGLASAAFYLPFRRVKGWAWESYWLVGGVFSWIIAPWAFALILTPDLLQVLAGTSTRTLLWTYFFGVLWGIGGLTFGLTMRYLGIALGMAMALGYCAAFGTLMGPLFDRKLFALAQTKAGATILFGVFVCLAGIVVSGLAGRSKEREMTAEQKQLTIREFRFGKGVFVATVCGILSACMAYAFAAGAPIGKIAEEHGTPTLFRNLPVLCVVLAGGFTTNFLWCVFLNIRNHTSRDYLTAVPDDRTTKGKRLFSNYAFCAVAGVIWYLQFFFYGMGTTFMGLFDFSSWTLHMASIMIFGTIFGLLLGEWRGASTRTRVLNALGLLILISSTVIVGYGNSLDKEPAEPVVMSNIH